MLLLLLLLQLLLSVGQCDLVASRLIAMEKTEEWAEANGIQSSIVEVSAKNDDNVRTIFRKLFDQARRSTTALTPTDAAAKGSPGPGRAASTARPAEDPLLLKRHFSANAARMSAKHGASSAAATNSLTVDNDPASAGQKPISRSRSLIRRMRKPKVKDSAELTANDCIIC